MFRNTLCALGLISLIFPAAHTGSAWADAWPPREYLLKSLVHGIPGIMKNYDAKTGRFGTAPWICSDQNVLLPLAAVWSIQDPANPYYHSDEILQAIAKGGEALVDDMDQKGMWIFRKKDHSTWGQIHMPWTYSRWIRAYRIVRDALPPQSRAKWEKGLRLGYSNIRKYADSAKIHNIPTHHAMSLYIAGVCFNNEDWKTAARNFMAKAVAQQNPAGFWSENFGPVVTYNEVYVEALGLYYHFSKDAAVLDALRRSAVFHSSILWPDGSSVPCIDERVVYHKHVDTGNVGFSWTPEGRGFLLKQTALYIQEKPDRKAAADYAANMLLYGGGGEGIAPPSTGDKSAVFLGNNDILIRRDKPWQWAFSAYATPPIQNRWIQDRQNPIDIYHDALGLVAGGGNTKIQPYWSTFTVGDPGLLKHRKGDTNPQFAPKIDLVWTPAEAKILNTDSASKLDMRYGDLLCKVTVAPSGADSLVLTYEAPAGRRAEAHLPLMMRGARLKTAAGEAYSLTEEPLLLTREQTGESILLKNLRVTIPEGASLRWPEHQHNPYTKDGNAPLGNAKLVLCIPFEKTGKQTVTLSYETGPPFNGLVFEATQIPSKVSENGFTKPLDEFGAQLLGRCPVGATLTFTLPEIAPGDYDLSGDFVLAEMYGIVEVQLDGKTVGAPFDAYAPAVDVDGARASFGRVTLGAGPHTITLKIAGKNPKSRGNIVSVKRWLLAPVGRADK